MKTLQEIKDEVANKYDYNNWDNVSHKECFFKDDVLIGYEDMFNEVCERYAKEAFNEGRDKALEEANRIVRLARADEIDQDFRVIIHIMKKLKNSPELQYNNQ